jgi:lysine 2,3-aminomutase
VPPERWADWRWQLKHSLRSVADLQPLLALSPEDAAALADLERRARLAVSPYYFSLINPAAPQDPIRLQAIPSARELAAADPAGGDPLEEEQDSPVPGLTHRYPDRVLMVLGHLCSTACRFCTRRRLTIEQPRRPVACDDDRMVQYVLGHPEVRDVVLSGGDPLLVSPARLRRLLGRLAAIEHVDLIRVGTRVPVTLPQRIADPALLEMLASAGKVWIQTHFNHPREITPEAAQACERLIRAGLPVTNQTVLLKGVNDSLATLRDLMRGLLRIKVRPYYLFHCDPVPGIGHFRTSVWKGLEIMEGLRGHVSGLAVPTYVVDGLRGAGKVPLMPNYLLSASEEALVLRNYEGVMFRYAPQDAAAPDGAAGRAASVSDLVSGAGEALVPADNPRHRRRAAAAAHQPPADAVSLCSQCAQRGPTCCENVEVYVTLGDVSRIAAFTASDDFHEFRQATPDYLDQDDDPLYLASVFTADGSRRVLRRDAAGRCHFLATAGCTLPMEVRPLICRLHPCHYTARGIEGLEPGCPVQLLPPRTSLLEALGFSAQDAERWHRMLYAEIRREPHARPATDGLAS